MDVLHTSAELSKIFYTKAQGTDPIFMKLLIPQLGSLLREPASPEALLAALKTVGIMVNQASIVPVRMQQFFKDLIEQNYDTELAQILMSKKHAPAIEQACCLVIAQLINPAFGDTYSFPWKRGPHDQLIEYQDLVPLVEQIRCRIYKKLTGSGDFIGHLLSVFQNEKSDKVVVKTAVFRIFTQLLRLRKDADQASSQLLAKERMPAELMTASSQMITLLNQQMQNSKDHIIKALSILILLQLLK